MNILDSILGAQNGAAVHQLGRQFGLSDDQVSSALSALVPMLAAGVQRNASSAQGLDGLMQALAGGRHQHYVDDLGALSQPATVADGNGILGHILGSKDVSRQVATSAAGRTGISPDILKAMLPIVAAMMMGSMSRKAGAARTGAAAGGGLLDMLTPLLDRDRDGSVVDDVTGMIGKMFR